MRNEKILVLTGGDSSEREISLQSGAAVEKALREAGFQVELLDLRHGNLQRIAEIAPDAAFLALHGKGGEDGSIQGLLEWLNIPYTGSDVAASAVCMDKILTKKILLQSNVPTPPFLEIGQEDRASLPEIIRLAVEKLGLPFVAKACRQGSSIGTVMIHREEDALSGVGELFSFGDSILLEAFLSGRELSVPIFGNDDISALPIIEITSVNEFYDFDSKYTPGKCRHIIPARISASLADRVSELAKSAYRACRCRGFARVDVLLDGKEEPFVIEINSIPGMTDKSLFPDAAAAVGISFPSLCEKLVDLALEKK